MKSIAFLTFCLLSFTLTAQELSVKIKISNPKTDDYWIEVADRNCGATDNIINSFGGYYSWSDAKKGSERKECDQASKACKDYRGGGHDDWRLPAGIELIAIMNKAQAFANYAILKNEYEQDNIEIYFPYAGMIEVGMDKPTQVGREAFFWSSEGQGSSQYAVSLNFSKNFKNNPLNYKAAKLSVRCVRNVK